MAGINLWAYGEQPDHKRRPKASLSAIANLMSTLHLSERFPEFDRIYSNGSIRYHKENYSRPTVMPTRPEWLPPMLEALTMDGFTVVHIEGCTVLLKARSTATRLSDAASNVNSTSEVGKFRLHHLTRT